MGCSNGHNSIGNYTLRFVLCSGDERRGEDTVSFRHYSSIDTFLRRGHDVALSISLSPICRKAPVTYPQHSTSSFTPSSQIRLMIAAAALTSRKVLPQAGMDMALLSPYFINLPLAPAEGLIVVNSGFERNGNGQVRSLLGVGTIKKSLY
jgi:hypothetical protein